MAIQRLPYSGFGPLLRDYLPEDEEDHGTLSLIRKLAKVRKHGYLTKGELVEICRWKSHRAIWQVRRNHPAEVKRATRRALSTRTEKEKLRLLTSLHGVGVPMASSLLMLTNPRRYGVIDIRVWQLLHKLKLVQGNRRGVSFTCNQWAAYLNLIRNAASKFNVKTRDIERALFRAHSDFYEGTLYSRDARRN